MDNKYIGKIIKSCAFIPCYIKNKIKYTKVFMSDGKLIYSKYSVRKLLNDYMALNLTSFDIIKKICRKTLVRNGLVPLYISNDKLMIPLKTIKPFVKGDSCFGYVNIENIKNFDFEKKRIILRSGNYICFLDSTEVIKKRIAECIILKKQLKKFSIELLAG